MSKEEKGILELYGPYFYSFKVGISLFMIGFLGILFTITVFEFHLGSPKSLALVFGIVSWSFMASMFLGALITIIATIYWIFRGGSFIGKKTKEGIATMGEKARLDREEYIKSTKTKATDFENNNDYDSALQIWMLLRRKDGNSESYNDDINRVKKLIAHEREQARDYDAAIEIWEEIGKIDEATRVKKLMADEREQARDYDPAIKIWEELGEINEAARVRKLKSEQGSVKVAQSVVQGDQITKTEIKDSVLNRSNVGGGSSKMQELEKLTEMKKEGLIDDDEFKQMKKEILG